MPKSNIYNVTYATHWNVGAAAEMSRKAIRLSQDRADVLHISIIIVAQNGNMSYEIQFNFNRVTPRLSFLRFFCFHLTLIACGLILRFFLGAEDRNAAFEPGSPAETQPLLAQERTLLAVTALIVLALATSGLHGVALPFVALIGALVMASEKVSGLSFRKALKTVEWNLLLFLAGTLVIGEALMSTGTAALRRSRSAASRFAANMR